MPVPHKSHSLDVKRTPNGHYRVDIPAATIEAASVEEFVAQLEERVKELRAASMMVAEELESRMMRHIEVFPINERSKYTQYIKMLLKDVSGLEAEPEYAPPAGASMFRKSLMSVATQAALKIGAAPRLHRVHIEETMDGFWNEVGLLAAQDGMQGSRDCQAIIRAVELLKRLAKSATNCSDSDYALQSLGQLNLIISIAQNT